MGAPIFQESKVVGKSPQLCPPWGIVVPQGGCGGDPAGVCKWYTVRVERFHPWMHLYPCPWSGPEWNSIHLLFQIIGPAGVAGFAGGNHRVDAIFPFGVVSKR